MTYVWIARVGFRRGHSLTDFPGACNKVDGFAGLTIEDAAKLLGISRAEAFRRDKAMDRLRLSTFALPASLRKDAYFWLGGHREVPSPMIAARRTSSAHLGLGLQV